MRGMACPAAVELAERMARSYMAACGAADEPGGGALEPLVLMLLPAAEIATEARALAAENEARLDALAAVTAGLVLRDAEVRGEFDAALIGDGGETGVRARKEDAPGNG